MIFFWIILMSFGIYVDSSRVNGSVVTFPFYEINCLNDEYTDICSGSIGYLKPSLSNQCLDSNGVFSGSHLMYLSSSKNVSTLKSKLGTNGYSIEFWLKVNESITQDSSIMSIETLVAKDNSLCPNGYQMALMQKAGLSNDTIGFTIANCATFSKSYVESPLPTLIFNKTVLENVVNHFVITLSFETSGTFHGVSFYYMTMNMTINGKYKQSSSLGSTSSFSPSSWTSGAKLYLFSNPLLSNYWPGRIYFFSIYEKVLTSDQIIQNYNAKIPYSLPVVTSFSVIINENGEIGNHTNDPNFYSKPIPSNEVSIIELTGYDFDDTISSPNYNPNNKKFFIQLVDIPIVGTLYYVNGTEIVNNGYINLINSTSNKFPIRYRPPYNNYTTNYNIPTTILTYRGISGITGNVSNTVATVSIFVKKVPKPPRLASSSSINVLADVLTTITLIAKVDNPLKSIVIKKLPSNGQIEILGSTSSVLSVGSVIKSSTKTTAYIRYIYTGTSIVSNTTTGLIGYDSFDFLFKDSTNRTSVAESMNISIYTSIVAKPNDDIFVVQSECRPIQLYGEDASSIHRNLSVVITSLPTYGNIYTNKNCSSNSSIVVNTQLNGYLNYNYAKGIKVYFKSSNDSFFNYPNKTFNGSILNVEPDSFQYKLISSDGSSSIHSTQKVNVKNLNHATNISFSYTYPWQDGIKIYVQSDKESATTPTKAIVNGFSLTDPDRETNLIRCVINKDAYTYIMLNQEYAANLLYDTSDYCNSNNRWLCQPYSTYISTGGFIGTPKEIENALNGMTIKSIKIDYTSVISITLYDGEGGECMDNSIQPDTSIRVGCFNTSTTFQVTMLGFAGYSTTNSFQSKKSSTLSNLIYIVLYIIGAILIVLILRKFCRCVTSPYRIIMSLFTDKKVKKKIEKKLKIKDKHIEVSHDEDDNIFRGIPLSTLATFKRVSNEMKMKKKEKKDKVVTPDRITEYSNNVTPERSSSSRKKKKKRDQVRKKSEYNDTFEDDLNISTSKRYYSDEYYDKLERYDDESNYSPSRNSQTRSPYDTSPITPVSSPYDSSYRSPESSGSKRKHKRELPKRSKPLPSLFPDIESGDGTSKSISSSPKRSIRAYMLTDEKTIVIEDLSTGKRTIKTLDSSS